MNKDQLKSLIAKAIEEGDQPGGDIEVILSTIGKTLIGHHDGIYWLE